MADIVYLPVSKDNYDEIIRHLRNSFFVDEPLNKATELSERGHPHPELEQFSLEVLAEGISFVGILPSTGQVVGVILNGDRKVPDKNAPRTIYKCQKLQKIFDFLGTVDKDVDYINSINPKDLLEVKILSVDSAFRGRGIARRLYDTTEDYARSKNYKYIRADATGMFSQKIFQRVGFKTLKEVFYDSYPTKDAPHFPVHEPHVSFKLMVKEL